ncbi:MAG: hypothetical protein M1830_003637, partial [Pleopsidium flavum]
MNSLENFAVQASSTTNIKLMHKVENAESWKDSPDSDLRRRSEPPEHAQHSPKGKAEKQRFISAEMAVQPVRGVESAERPSTSRDNKTTNIEYCDDDNTAPRYSEKPPTTDELWDTGSEGKRRTRRTEKERLRCLRDPPCTKHQQAGTRVPHSIGGRTLLVTPEYILELFISVGVDSLSLRDLYLPWTAGFLPPVTAMSLTELDLQRIMNNTKLRADINYDGDLHFRPNLDGEKGRRKCREAKEYWKALTVELLLYWVYCSEGVPWHLPTFAPIVIDKQERSFFSRLPLMFQTIRGILHSLVPEQERLFVEERFDVRFLMQQIQRGCFDFKSLSVWLAQILKRHCAPMRDAMVDDMVKHINLGADNDAEVLVDGLKDLFGILEAMKLDVANHQIRSLRPLLIQDTITFQQNYFLRKIASGHISVRPAEIWYAHASEDQSIDGDSDGQRQIAMFFQALVQLLSSFDPSESFPSTFMFDIDRLWHLRSDVRDVINLDVCSKLFRTLLERAGHNAPATSEMLDSVQLACVSILEDFDGEARWTEHARSIALEITRSAHKICGTKQLSADLDFAEKFLTEAVGTGSGCWSHLQKKTGTAMWAPLIENVNAYQHMSPLDMLNHVEAGSRTASGKIPNEFDRITRRIAHIG